MGTSADRAAGKGGAWTPLKHATAAYVRNIGHSDSNLRARRVLARHVPLLGGAAGAAASSRAGRDGFVRLGGLLAGFGTIPVEQVLGLIGLEHLVGRDRFEVLDELITFIAGSGDDLDSTAARDAACDVLDDVFGDANSWADIDQITVDSAQLQLMLERFLALYVYNRVPVVAERLSRMTDPAAMRRADAEMRQIIENLVAVQLPEDPLAVDWAGPEGRSIAEQAIASAYELLSALDREDRG